MPQLSPRHDRESLLCRLDRAARRINPLLMVIAIGLAILDASCLITLLDNGSLTVHLSRLSPVISARAAGAVRN